MIEGKVFLIILGIISLYGGLVLFLTLRQKVKKPLKKFLLLTGASALGFPVLVVLHNLFYALEAVTQNLPILSGLTGFLHALFFLIATLVCPLGFLAGVITSLALLAKKRK